MTNEQQRRAEITKPNVDLAALLPCPFCGGTNLLSGYWSLDDEEVDAVECGDCYAGAPITAWNKRHESA